MSVALEKIMSSTTVTESVHESELKLNLEQHLKALGFNVVSEYRIAGTPFRADFASWYQRAAMDHGFLLWEVKCGSYTDSILRGIGQGTIYSCFSQSVLAMPTPAIRLLRSLLPKLHFPFDLYDVSSGEYTMSALVSARDF
jgi:hypothetical protein